MMGYLTKVPIMKTWNDTVYKLENSDILTVCEHAETSSTVSLGLPGYAADGRGFAIYFTTGQIEAIATLLQELRDLKALEHRANQALLEEDLAK